MHSHKNGGAPRLPSDHRANGRFVQGSPLRCPGHLLLTWPASAPHHGSCAGAQRGSYQGQCGQPPRALTRRRLACAEPREGAARAFFGKLSIAGAFEVCTGQSPQFALARRQRRRCPGLKVMRKSEMFCTRPALRRASQCLMDHLMTLVFGIWSFKLLVYKKWHSANPTSRKNDRTKLEGG